MERVDLIKRASSLARKKCFDEAIDVLISVYKSGDYNDSDLFKIVPYFQKAGRYIELESFCEETIIPSLKYVYGNLFHHKCLEIQTAYVHIGLYKLCGKLELCAKREKLKEDELKYRHMASLHLSEYEKYLAKGEVIEEKRNFEEMKEVFGNNVSLWPSSIKEKFKGFV